MKRLAAVVLGVAVGKDNLICQPPYRGPGTTDLQHLGVDVGDNHRCAT